MMPEKHNLTCLWPNRMCTCPPERICHICKVRPVLSDHPGMVCTFCVVNPPQPEPPPHQHKWLAFTRSCATCGQLERLAEQPSQPAGASEICKFCGEPMERCLYNVGKCPGTHAGAREQAQSWWDNNSHNFINEENWWDMAEVLEAYATQVRGRLLPWRDLAKKQQELTHKALELLKQERERADAAERELARFKALEAHLPEGYAIGDDATATLAVEVESLRTELREIKQKLERWAGDSPIDKLDRLILQWEDRANWGREQALKRESAERELRDMREALERLVAIRPQSACDDNPDHYPESCRWCKAKALLSRKGEGS